MNQTQPPRQAQSEPYNRLRKILAQMFQLDQAELDFGIYRIMNQKRAEINDFLDQDLLTQIHDTLASSGESGLEDTKKELQQLERTLRGAGVDVDQNQKVQELREEIARGGSTEALELEVYSRLTQFFKRYYQEGDFISQRRYKEGVYAIPYEGEEVKLYWANHDQYYIKTGEYFKNYRFQVGEDQMVHFTLKEANTERDNNKASSGEERRFRLYEDLPFEEMDGELHIYFTYEVTEKKIRQDQLNKKMLKTLSDILPGQWNRELLRLKPTEKNKKRTLLEYRLQDYTAKNTFDFFIHKDLEGFLKRELDFYIKNEILRIDDIDLDDEQHFQKQLLLIKALKKVAHKIIDFLAQIENFQKKLWLKKKMVLQADYCITLDRIDAGFYTEISENPDQLREWIDLFAIDELVDYTDPLTVDFLKRHPFLLLDTRFFSREFKYRLLATIPDIDAQCDGLLINSENFQALELLQERFKGILDCCHIDPPYNTETSGFKYKNNFKSSSWLSFMHDRLTIIKYMLKDEGVFFGHIDHNEYINFDKIAATIFNINQGTIVWDKRNPAPGSSIIARQHEYILAYSETMIKLRREKVNGRAILDKVIEIKGKNDLVSQKEKENFKRWVQKQKGFSGGEKAYHQIEGNGDVYRLVHLGASEQRTDPKYFIPFKHPVTGKDCPVPSRGWTGEPNFMKNLLSNDLIVFGQDESIQPQRKYYLKDTIFGEFTSVITYGGKGKNEVDNLGIEFPYCHASDFYEIFIKSGAIDLNSTILDYFAGSGTTGHAVINLNREDGGKRKYILVEMGEYFNTVTKPRIQKVVYSDEWKNGKPTSRQGSSHCFKYMRLESYEDTLNNLVLKKTDVDAGMQEEYMLRYSLDVESRDSLLMQEAFRRPWGYTIRSTEHNEERETDVDLVETFNYLIGLQVETMEMIRGYVVVTGKTLEEKKVLVIWRDMDEHSNADLNEFCRKMRFNPLDYEWDRIYVNGDNNIENLKIGEERWKVKLIEHEFHHRMWEGSS